MSESIVCNECSEIYSDDECGSCPHCSEEELITCDVCGTEYSSEDDGCLRCDESTPPKGTECEFCEKLATYYVQDHPACEEHYDDAYPNS